jgi:flagella basal body P-ring formation protein FlgA
VTLFQPAAGSPVAVRVRAGVLDTALVAARPLARGAVLAAQDIGTAVRVRWARPGASQDRPGEGWMTRRPLAVGEELSAVSVLPPQVVRSGDPVRLEWREGAVTVVLDGVALGSGAMGETVRVRLAERGGQRTGRITGPGSVRLDS